jgi:tetratricopeptide (TPR) repeat protein/CHAT domain-containing protein
MPDGAGQGGASPGDEVERRVRALNVRVLELYEAGLVEQALPLAVEATGLARRALEPDHPNLAASINSLAELYRLSGDFDAAEPLYREAVDATRRRLGDRHPDHATCLANLALLFANAGKPELALTPLQQALDIRRESLGPHHPLVLDTLRASSNVSEAVGDYAAAARYLEAAIDIEREARGLHDLHVLVGLSDAGALRYAAGDYDDAETIFRQAVQGLEDAQGESPVLATTLENLAAVEWELAHPEEAVSLLRRALDIRRRTQGEDHVDVIHALDRLASRHRSLGDDAAAATLLEEALELQESGELEADTDVGRRLNDLGGLYLADGRYSDAQRSFERALEIARQTHGERQPETAVVLRNLGALQHSLGRRDEAERLYDEALDIMRESLGEDLSTAAVLADLAVLYEETGREAAAITMLEQALAIRRKLLGEISREVADALSRLATVYRRIGDDARAEEYARDALEVGVAALGPAASEVMAWRQRLAQLLQAAGKNAEAEKLLRTQLEQARERWPEGHAGVFAAQDALAAHLEAVGDRAAALSLEREALDARRAVLGGRHLDVAANLERLASIHRSAGEVDQALAEYEEALDIRRESVGSAPDLAANLVRLADLRLEARGATEALPLYQEAVALYELLGHHGSAVGAAETVLRLRRAGSDHLEHSAAANNLAELLRQIDDYERAEPLYEEALASLAAAPETPETETDRATILSNRALLKMGRGHHLEARPLLEEALGLLRAQSATSAALAAVLNNLSQTYWELGDFASADDLLRESLEVRREVHGPQSPAVARALHQLGRLRFEAGDYHEARELLEQALEMGVETQGWEHPDVAVTAGMLAHLHRRLGDLDRAEDLLRFALGIQRNALGPDDPDVAFTLGGLAQVAQEKGDYATAEQLFRESGDILRRRLGDSHPEVATNLNNLASLLNETGDYVAAEAGYRKAIEIMKAVGNEVATATTLNNLALLLWRGKNDLFGAIQLLRESLEIRQRVLGDRHPDVAQALNNLGAISGWLAPEEAESLLQEALSIKRARFGEDHPEVAETLNNLAYHHQGRAEYAKAQTLFEQALEIRRKSGGDDPDTAMTLTSLGAVLALRGDTQRALAAMEESQKLHDRLIAKVSGLASEQQRLAYLDLVSADFHALLTLVSRFLPGDPVAVRTAFDVLMRRKAIGAEALSAQRDAVLGGRYPSLAPRLAELSALRAEIAARTLGRADGAGYPSTLSDLTTRRESLERELARKIPEMRLAERLDAADREAVAGALPDGAALVEFVRFEALDFAANAPGAKLEIHPFHYAAFVLPAGRGGDVRLIELPDADVVERAIAAYRSVITGEPELAPDGTRFRRPPSARAAEMLETRLGIDLRRMVFDPVVPALEGRTRLFLAPDGDLSRLPFEVLPTDDGRFLVDDYLITYVTVARDTVRFGAVASAASAPLVVADPAFDLDDGRSLDGTTFADDTRPRAFDDVTFEGLAGTRAEGERVATLLQVEPLLGPEALESRVKSCRSPRILHLATHGFFLGDPEPHFGALDSSVPAALATGDPLIARLGRAENPMLRSGLALAGANTWLAGKPLPVEAEDGLLTAEDVTTLDLLGTRLVVLSACETGLGSVRAGEGVFGFRRAFALAGAETLIMSLWKVPDETTRELMELYYAAILSGRRRDDALRSVQLSIRAKHPDTRSWGAFICQGDPTELDAAESPSR